MCCRYYMDGMEPDGKLAAIVEMMKRNWPDSYKTGEIFPGDTVPALIAVNGKIKAVPAVFGFSGFENGRLLLNARSETAASKRSFAESLRSRRIILPATEFYEWGCDADRTKYSFRVGSSHVMYLCGIYDTANGQPHFVILTREANASMAEQITGAAVWHTNTSAKYNSRYSDHDAVVVGLRLGNGEQGFEMTISDPQAEKILRDGQLIIIRGGVEYTVTGQRL